LLIPDQVDVITAPQGTNAKESAHPGRSRKRKAGNNPSRDEVNIRLGQQIERTSERLLRGHRPMKLSAEDKASQMTLDDSHKNISSTKGYCMVSNYAFMEFAVFLCARACKITTVT